MANILELRRANIPVTVGEVSSDTQAVKVSGYAVLYDTPSIEMCDDGLSFREIIAHGAFDAQMGEGADVRLLIEHGGAPIARTGSGTLTLRSDSKGIYFETELDASDPDVQRLIPKMKRGDLSNMSFGFSADEDGDSYSLVGREVIRSVQQGKLYEISIVGFPAYAETTVSMRSRNAIRSAMGDVPTTSATEIAITVAELTLTPASALDVARARVRLASL